MLCPKCKASNPPGEEYCFKCGMRLPLLRMPGWDEEAPDPDLEENLLERISSLEENFREVRESLSHIREVLDQQEKVLFLNHNAFLAMMEHLSSQGILSKDDLYARWEESLNQSLRQLSLSNKFAGSFPRIMALYLGDNPEDFARGVSGAADLITAGDFREGVQALENLFDQDTDNYELACYIGDVYFSHHATEKAERFLRITLKASPRHTEALILHGLVLLERSSSQESALERFRKAHEQSGESAVTALCYGAASSVCGHHERALELLSDSLSRSPSPLAYLLKGRILAFLSRSHEALKALRSSADLDPDFSPALIALTLHYLEKGRNRKALDTLGPVVTHLQPRVSEWLEPPTDFFLPHALDSVPSSTIDSVLQEIDVFVSVQGVMHEDRLDTIIGEFGRAPYALAVLASEALQRGRENLAFTLARTLMEEETKPIERAVALSILYRSGQDLHRLRALFAETLEKIEDSKSRFALYYLAALVELRGFSDYRTSRRLLMSAMEFAPQDIRWRVLMGLGWLNLLEGNKEEALEQLTESFKLYESPGALLLLGIALTAASKTKEAIETLHQAWPLHRGIFPTFELLRDEVSAFKIKSVLPQAFHIPRGR
ncbi:hypothetical protein ACFLU6_04175 [Acidobacteriota bacterium]